MTHPRVKHMAVLLAAVLGQIPCVFGEAPSPASPVSLRRCYEWAKERDEDLKVRREDIAQSRARARAALGGAYPNIDWTWTDTFQDPAGVDKLSARGFGGFVEKNQVESRFTLKQPIFSGLREFSAHAGFKRESARNELLLERADKALFARTAEAFYTVLLHEADRENTDAALTLAQDRVRELRGFRRLGKARDSEVFTAEARAAALTAQKQRIQSRVASAREALSYLTGQDLSSVALADEIPGPPDAGPLEDALARARGRTDLRAQREDAAGKKLRVRYEKGQYWPGVDVTGNYYTQRATFLDDIAWDVVLSLRVPLFQGGSVSARAREASSAYRQSLLTLERMEREILHSVRTIHGELVSAVLETRSLEEAARAARKSYDALLEEYRLGLVTNLEVLQAMDLLQAQNGAGDAARLNAKMLFLRLGVETEALPR